jgi:hypothetical protein
MKKLLVLLAFLPAAPVFAVPVVPGGKLPGGVGPAEPLTCEKVFDSLIAKLQGQMNKLDSRVALLVGDDAFAESPILPPSGFEDFGGTAQRSGNKINGTSKVAMPGYSSKSASLTYVISKVDGKARLSWTYNGLNYASNIDSCSSGYWTAATSKSAIIVKLSLPPIPA